MNSKIKFMAIAICMQSLTSCMVNDDTDRLSYETYTYVGSQPVPQNYYYSENYVVDSYQKKEVAVPETYHVGQFHSPVSFKDRDRTWVKSQSPTSYTIELADDEKADLVAKKLYKAPKNDRMGQVQYQRDGKEYYKGLYGSYENAQAAQKALDALPPEIKQGAGVKNWGAVQGNLNE